MAEIRFDRVGKVYADGTRAVTGVDLEILDKQFVVLVGPSGCGKTTLLRMVAGLERITEGEIRIGDRVVNDVAAKDRDIAMVFQNYALYPHLTVRDNIAFGLRLRRVPKQKVAERVDRVAQTLGLVDQLDKRPAALSGGQRQRVAMGRAMVREPQAFLMDEPLSNLDAKLRVQMRAEIGRRQKELGVTTLYVTHDQTEAMTLGDLVAVMRRGVIQQVAKPDVLFDRPANLFVATFVGSPAMNLVEATVEAIDDSFFVAFANTRLRIPPAVMSTRPAIAEYVGRKVALGLRPEDFTDPSVSGGRPTTDSLDVKIELRETLGREAYLHFLVNANPILTEDIQEVIADTDTALLEELLEGDATTKTSRFIARVDSLSRARGGDHVTLAVNTNELHFFDIGTGMSIYSRHSVTTE